MQGQGHKRQAVELPFRLGLDDKTRTFTIYSPEFAWIGFSKCSVACGLADNQSLSSVCLRHARFNASNQLRFWPQRESHASVRSQAQGGIARSD